MAVAVISLLPTCKQKVNGNRPILLFALSTFVFRTLCPPVGDLERAIGTYDLFLK